MNALVGIAGVALLFAIFGLVRRGREPEPCESCGGGCASRGGCHMEPSSHGGSTDADS